MVKTTDGKHHFENSNCLMQSSMTLLSKVFLEYRNPFWSQAFKALTQCSKVLLNENPENHLRTNILQNMDVVLQNPIQHTSIHYCSIESLLDSDRNLLDRTSINNRFPNLLPTWLHYINLRKETAKYLSYHCVKNVNFVPAQTLPTIDYITLFLTRSSKGCRHFYKVLSKCDNHSGKIWSGHKGKWEEKIGEIDQTDWENSIINFTTAKFSNKLIDLNILILRNNIITNNKLFLMKKINYETCNFCKEIDKTIHRMHSCIHSRKIWISLEEIFAFIGIYTVIDQKLCILGDPDMSPNSVKNFLISYTKFFLQNCHQNNTVPSVPAYIWFIAKLVITLNDPLVIVKIPDNKNWRKLKSFFDNG